MCKQGTVTGSAENWRSRRRGCVTLKRVERMLLTSKACAVA